MKKSLIFVGMLAIGYANAQEGNVGINTDQPKATLDIQPNATNLTGTTNEGIIAPRLSKTRIANIEASKLTEGTLVYATDEATSPISAYAGTDTKVAKITEKGYYFYNGTEWVKAGANGELWAQKDNSGVTETYLKPAETDGNKVYYSPKGVTNLLGTITENNIWETGNTIAYKFDEVPSFTGINSSRFKKTNIMTNGNYLFSGDSYQLFGADVVRGKSYIGKSFSSFVNDDVSSNIGSFSGQSISASHKGSSKVDYLSGLNVYTFMGTVHTNNSPEAISNNAANFHPRILKGKVDNLTGLYIRPYIYGGEIKSLFGTNILLNTSELLAGVTTTLPTINYTQAVGYKVDVYNNTNITTKHLAGADFFTGYRNGSTAESGYSILGRGNVEEGATLNNYHGVVSSLGATGTANVENVYGFKHNTNFPSTFKPNNQYGLWIDNIANGQTSNFSIYTNAGKVRVGDLADTGATTDRVVTVDANGVLKTGSVANIPAVQVGSTTSMTCDDANRGKMNFVKDVDLGGGKTADAFAVCLKGSDGKHYWRYLYGAGGVTNLQGDFGTGLQ